MARTRRRGRRVPGQTTASLPPGNGAPPAESARDYAPECGGGHDRTDIRQAGNELVKPVRPVTRGARPDNFRAGSGIQERKDRTVFAVTAGERSVSSATDRRRSGAITLEEPPAPIVTFCDSGVSI